MLSHDELLSLINKEPPLVAQMIDPEVQVQPNGVELILQIVKISKKCIINPIICCHHKDTKYICLGTNW